MASRIRRNHSAGGVTYRTMADDGAGTLAAVPAVAGIKVASRWQRQQVSLKALSSQWGHQYVPEGLCFKFANFPVLNFGAGFRAEIALGLEPKSEA
jgi:hypothetical protein